MPKWLVWALLASPSLWMAWRVWAEIQAPGSSFGADPGQEVVHYFGSWAMYLVIGALAIGTLDRLFRRSGSAVATAAARAVRRHRRAVGVAAFLYVTLHLTMYVVLLNGASVAAIAEDFVERPYIIAGLVGFVLLAPLATTSTNGWVRRLGAVRWRSLHRLAYPAALAAWVHVLWLAKSSYFDAALFGTLIAVLLAERLGRLLQASGAGASPGSAR